MAADDVVTSLQRWIRLSPRGKLAGEYVDSITAADPAGILLTLKRPCAPLPRCWPIRTAPPRCAKRLATAPDPLKEFVGTGPYKLIEYKPDQYIRLAKFADCVSPPGPAAGYAGQRQPLIDELRFAPLPIRPRRPTALLSGEYQFADLLTPESYARLANQPTVRQGLVDSPNACNMIFNTKAGLLSDVRLRRAVRLAIQPPDMLAAAFSNPPLWRLEGSVYPQAPIGTSDNPRLQCLRSRQGQGTDAAGRLRRQTGALPGHHPIRLHVQDRPGRSGATRRRRLQG